MNEVNGPASSSEAIQSTVKRAPLFLRITPFLLFTAALSALTAFYRSAAVRTSTLARSHDAFTVATRALGGKLELLFVRRFLLSEDWKIGDLLVELIEVCGRSINLNEGGIARSGGRQLKA